MDANNYHTIPLPRRQAERAHALASAFGHGWAACPPPGADEAIGALMISGDASPKVISDIYAEAARHAGWEPWRCGIPGPDVNDSGIVVHGTGTGRLVWTVDRGGGVEACIYRPDSKRPVLRLLVGDAGPEASKPGGAYHERHVFALRGVAEALGVAKEFDDLGLLDTALLDADDVMLISLRDGREVTDEEQVFWAVPCTEDDTEDLCIVDGIGRLCDGGLLVEDLCYQDAVSQVVEGDLVLIPLSADGDTYEACVVRRKLPFDQGGEEVTS